MKKYIALILTCALALAVLPAFAEEVRSVAGDWYTRVDGIPCLLTLDPDGIYTFTDLRIEPKTGTWEFRDGYIYLDGSAAPNLYTLEDKLCVGDTAVFFTREKPAGYTPGEPFEDILLTMFAGYWRAEYVDLAGTPVPAFALEDETDLYVEGHSAILGGPVLGDVIVKLAEQDGTLVTEDGSAPAATLVLQQDGLLKLTVIGSDTAPQTWYMMRSWTAVLDGETKDD